MTAEEAMEKPYLMPSTFILNSLPIHVLVDSGAILSFVLTSIAQKKTTSLTLLIGSIILEVINLNQDIIKENYREWQLQIYRITFPIDLNSVITEEFDVMEGMDWLSTKMEHVICNLKL